MYHCGGDVNIGGPYASLRAGDIWEVFEPSAHFCCELLM